MQVSNPACCFSNLPKRGGAAEMHGLNQLAGIDTQIKQALITSFAQKCPCHKGRSEARDQVVAFCFVIMGSLLLLRFSRDKIKS